MSLEMTVAERRQKVYRRNFAFFVADSALYGFVMSIFSQSTILPHYISTMTDSKTLLGLLPAIVIISNIAQVASSVFTIRAVNKRPMMIWVSLLQRVVFIGITASVGVLRAVNPAAGLTAFFVSYVAYSLSNSYMSPIWSSVFAGAIVENRGLYFGLTSMFSNALGFFGAFLTRSLLKTIAYPSNFEMIFMIGTAVSFLSFLSLALVKYYPDPAEARTDFTFQTLFHSVREILRVNRPYRSFLIARAGLAIGEVSFGFLTANFVAKFSLSEGEVGTANIVMIVSQFVFPLLFGRLRDKKGGETVFMVISAVGITALLVAIFAPSALVYYAVFVLLGAIMSPIYMATNTSTMAYADRELLPAYTAITGLSLIPFTGFGSLLAGALGDAFGYEVIYALSIAGFSAAFWLFSRRRAAQKARAQSTT